MRHEHERHHERVGARADDGEGAAHDLESVADIEAVAPGHDAANGDLVVGLWGPAVVELPWSTSLARCRPDDVGGDLGVVELDDGEEPADVRGPVDVGVGSDGVDGVGGEEAGGTGEISGAR